MKRKTFVIAEIGVNHNGDTVIAQDMICAAAEARVDAVKFQTFDTDKLVTKKARKAAYQGNLSENQYSMLRGLAISFEDHHILKKCCEQRGVEFLSTPFDEKSLEFLVRELKVKRLKISSGDLTNGPLLLACAQSGLNTIVSTGMATLAEVKSALDVLTFGYSTTHIPTSEVDVDRYFDRFRDQLDIREKVTLLHCTTEYPAPVDEVNLRAIVGMREEFGLKIGYSDHTLGVTAAIGAVVLGATVIEKHFTLDRSLPGPDHAASLEPREFIDLVKSIEEVEKNIGSREKKPQPSETKNIQAARRSIVATKGIKAGEKFSKQNIGIKRPGNGLSPNKYWEILGSVCNSSYEEGELIH